VNNDKEATRKDKEVLMSIIEEIQEMLKSNGIDIDEDQICHYFDSLIDWKNGIVSCSKQIKEAIYDHKYYTENLTKAVKGFDEQIKNL
jgi:ABC-type uncharacterized transport system substrate-binding protein